MTALPAARAARSGLTGRPLQSVVTGVVVLAATAAATLALGMTADTSAPFDRAFARDHGAQVAVTADTSVATPAELAATARLPGVLAAAGPFAETAVTAQLTVPGAAGTLQQQVVLTGRASPGGPVDDLSLDAGRWARATGEVVWSSRNNMPVSLGQKIAVAGVPGSPRLTVVGIATSVTNTAQAWVTPAEITALGGPGAAQVLYRFAAAGSDAAVSADIAAVRAALPRGALLGTPVSYLAVKQAASASIAPWVPFIVAFGVIALVMSVLIVVNVISGAVVAGTRRIGVLKSVGFTPAQVTAAYTLQAAIPAAAGCAAGAVLGELLSVPLLNLNGAVYGVGVLLLPAWVAVAVPLAMLALSGAAALAPALRAGRLSAVQAIATGRAPRAAHGYLAHRLLGRLEWAPRTVTIGLAAPFARPARTLVTLAAIGFGATAAVFGAGLGTSLNRAATELSLVRTEPVQVSPDAGSLTGARQQAIVSALDGQPGTAHYTTETDTQLSVPGLAGPLSVTAYADDAGWTGWSLITGRWYSGNGQADVNTYFLTATGTQVGGTYTLTSGRRQVTVRITGQVFDTRGNTADMFVSSATLAAVAPGLAPQQYDVAVRRGTSVQSYVNALSARLGPSYSLTTSTDSPVFKSVLALLVVLTVLLMAVAGLGVLNTVVLQVRERAHDLGIYKAIGMTPRQVLAMVVCSVTGIGVTAGLIAIPAGITLHHYVVPVMAHAAQTAAPTALQSVYPTPELVLLALAGPLIAAAGALGPASWITRIRTTTALRAE
jgi:putative ABC transport system permease protein